MPLGWPLVHALCISVSSAGTVTTIIAVSTAGRTDTDRFESGRNGLETKEALADVSARAFL